MRREARCQLRLHAYRLPPGQGPPAQLLAELARTIIPIKSQTIAELSRAYRARTGMKVIPLEKAAMPVYPALRRGEMVVFLAGPDLAGTGLEVHFFGREVSLHQGLAYFGLRNGSPILPGHLAREGDDYTGVIKPSLRSHAAAKINTATQRISERLENQIGDYPDRWFVFKRIEDGV